MKIDEKFRVFALGTGVTVPLLYFGIQIFAAPFYAGYSFLTHDASTLGSDGSSFPSIFNIGSIIVGIMTLVASWGFLRSFQRLGVYPFLAWMTAFCLISGGLASINAGIFPLPDPRHTFGLLAFLGIAMFLLPVLLPITFRKLHSIRPIKIYFIVNIVITIALIPIMSGLIQRFSIMAGVGMPGYQSFLNNYQGLLQRIAALVVFAPIGISAYVLRRRISDLLRTVP